MNSEKHNETLAILSKSQDYVCDESPGDSFKEICGQHASCGDYLTLYVRQTYLSGPTGQGLEGSCYFKAEACALVKSASHTLCHLIDQIPDLSLKGGISKAIANKILDCLTFQPKGSEPKCTSKRVAGILKEHNVPEPAVKKIQRNIQALESIRELPVRLKCVQLPFKTYLEGLEALERNTPKNC